MQCETCGAGLKPGATRCIKCGTEVRGAVAPPPVPAASAPASAAMPLQAGHSYCAGCGTPILATAAACSRCGAPQAAYVGNVKSRVTAGVLALLLGGIGVHKFYCGKIGIGIVYLIFCWSYIPFIIGFIEGIIYLSSSMSDADFTRRYCA